MTDRDAASDLEGVKRAQQRVWELQAAGQDPNEPVARRAVNHLMGRIRRLNPATLTAFEHWKAGVSRD